MAKTSSADTRLGMHTALDFATFTVSEVAHDRLAGPNGAGNSTTMWLVVLVAAQCLRAGRRRCCTMGAVSSDDPFESVTPEMEAAAAEYYANLAPPAWFYPLVGEVASAAVLLELYVTEVALALTGSQKDARQVIKSPASMWAALNKAQKRNDRFDDLLRDFQPARDNRDAIVHAVLWWNEADGEYSDYWEQHHPRTDRHTPLAVDEPPPWMSSALHSIHDLTQRAFELANDLSTA